MAPQRFSSLMQMINGIDGYGSFGVIVVDDDDLFGTASSGDILTPLLDAHGGAADVPPAEAVAAESVEGADVAAVGVDVAQLGGLAQPVGADAVGVVDTSAGHSAAVPPPAVTAQELTHPK
jgi:hypothetical protein